MELTYHAVEGILNDNKRQSTHNVPNLVMCRLGFSYWKDLMEATLSFTQTRHTWVSKRNDQYKMVIYKGKCNTWFFYPNYSKDCNLVNAGHKHDLLLEIFEYGVCQNNKSQCKQTHSWMDHSAITELQRWGFPGVTKYYVNKMSPYRSSCNV